MRVLVTGTRQELTLSQCQFIFATVEEIFVDDLGIAADASTVVMHGDAYGVDRFVAEVVKAQGYTVDAYPADWAAHGKAAGFIRNQQMIEREPDVVIAFPGPGSKGTWDCVRRAREAGIRLIIHRLK